MVIFSAHRAAVLMLLIGTGFIALIGRVAYLQTYGRQQTIERADRQQHQSETLRARRGSIFDANGMLMAGTVQTQSLYVDPKFMQDCYQEDGKSLVKMDQDLDKLAKLIDKDPFELSQLIGDKYTSRFVKIAEHLDDRTVAEIHKLDMPGVGTLPTDERYYPMGSIAAHVLGGVQRDNIGLEGVELKYEKVLAGKDGFKRTLKDARRRPICRGRGRLSPAAARPAPRPDHRFEHPDDRRAGTRPRPASSSKPSAAKRRHGPEDRRSPGDGATGRRSTRRTWKIPSPNSAETAA